MRPIQISQSDVRALFYPLQPAKLPPVTFLFLRLNLSEAPEHTSLPVFTFMGPSSLSVMPLPSLLCGNSLCGPTQLKFLFLHNPTSTQTFALWKGQRTCSHSHVPKPYCFAESQHHTVFLCSLSFTWQLISSCCASSLMLLICRVLHALYYYVTPHVLSLQPELSSGEGGGSRPE